MSGIYADILNVYRLYSELISASITEGGPYASKTSLVKLLRSVKREVLRLIETFVERCEDPHLAGRAGSSSHHHACPPQHSTTCTASTT